MVRMISDESVEIYAGRDDEVITNPQTGQEERLPGQHQEWETYIIMDLKRRRFEIRSKYPFTIVCNDKVIVRGSYIDVVAEMQAKSSGKAIADSEGNDEDGNPVFSDHKGTQLRLRCTDATGKTGGFQEVQGGSGEYQPIAKTSTIIMTPRRVQCMAEEVRGFETK